MNEENETNPLEHLVMCVCGSDLFYESTQVRGYWKSILNGKGEVVESNLDDLKHAATPKTVICAECGKRNKNPRYESNT